MCTQICLALVDRRPPPPPYQTEQILSFRLHFSQKSPTSEVSAPSHGAPNEKSWIYPWLELMVDNWFEGSEMLRLHSRMADNFPDIRSNQGV